MTPAVILGASVWVMSGADAGDGTLVAALVGALRRLGHSDVWHVRDEDDLFANLALRAPALLILDLRHARDAGVSLLKDLKSDDGLANFGVLPVVEEQGREALLHRTAHYGIDTALTLPLSDERLGYAIARVLGRMGTDPTEALISSARTALRTQAFQTTEKLLLEARRLKPSMRTELGLAQVALAQDRREDCARYAEGAQALDPESFQVRLLGLAAMVEAAGRDAPTTEGGTAEKALWEAVASLLPQCLPRARLGNVLKILSGNPLLALDIFERHFDVFACRAQCLVDASRLCQAANFDARGLALAEQAMARGVQTGELYNLLGVFHKRAGNFGEAERFYLEALKVSPGDFRILYNLGLCYEDSGDADAARRTYASCLRVAPHFAKARERLEKLG